MSLMFLMFSLGLEFTVERGVLQQVIRREGLFRFVRHIRAPYHHSAMPKLNTARGS